jgi:hypothetical protein
VKKKMKRKRKKKKEKRANEHANEKNKEHGRNYALLNKRTAFFFEMNKRTASQEKERTHRSVVLLSIEIEGSP